MNITWPMEHLVTVISKCSTASYILQNLYILQQLHEWIYNCMNKKNGMLPTMYYKANWNANAFMWLSLTPLNWYPIIQQHHSQIEVEKNAVLQMTFSNVFSLKKMHEFRLKFHRSLLPKGPIDNIPALVQIMAWRRPGDKPLSELMMVKLPMHICITWPQWVNSSKLRVPEGAIYWHLLLEWIAVTSLHHSVPVWVAPLMGDIHERELGSEAS